MKERRDTVRNLEMALHAWKKLVRAAVRKAETIERLRRMGFDIQNRLIKAGWTREQCWEEMEVSFGRLRAMEVQYQPDDTEASE